MSHEKPTVGDVWVRRDDGQRVLVIGFGDGLNLKLWGWDEVSPDDLRKVCRFAFNAFDVLQIGERMVPEGSVMVEFDTGKHFAHITPRGWALYTSAEKGGELVAGGKNNSLEMGMASAKEAAAEREAMKEPVDAAPD